MVTMYCRTLFRTATPAVLALGVAASVLGGPVSRPALPERSAAMYARVPLHFEPNLGQANRSVTFLARGEGYGLLLSDDGAVLCLRHPAPEVDCPPCQAALSRHPDRPAPPQYSSVHMRLLGADTTTPARGVGRLPGRSAYLNLEGRPEQAAVPHFRAVRRAGVYPGIDLVVYGRECRVEYDFEVAPGADPRKIRLGFVGAPVRLERGDLVLDTPAGRLVQHAPVLYQTVRGKRVPVAGRYVRRGAGEVGFSVERYDRSRPLVIDPVLSFSTFLGGQGSDEGRGIAVDGAGNIIVTGQTESPNFPNVNQPPEERSFPGTEDAFVTKYNAAGTALIYSIYIGSDGWDAGEDVKTDAQGNAYVTGEYNGDMFVLKLSPTGAEVYGWAYGGISSDAGRGIAVDAQGNAYVTGKTESSDYESTPEWEGFPVKPNPGAISTNRVGSGDAFVCKVDPTGGLVYSTYLGGEESFLGEEGTDIAIDGQGNAYVVGQTFSNSFPVTATGLQRTYGGSLADAFFAKINPTGTAILYATYLGTNDFDAAYGVAADNNGNAYITGCTYAFGFPVSANAFQNDWNIGDCDPDPFKVQACPDAFVTKIDTKLSGNPSMVYSTYFGSNYSDIGRDIVVDKDGHACIVGQTLTVDFPEKDPLPTRGTSTDAFVTVFNTDGSGLLFSTRIGGAGSDAGLAIALGPTGDIYVTGRTASADFPKAQPYQNTIGSDTYDAFVARIAYAGALPAGDVNGDGRFDVNDVLLAIRMAGGLATGADGAARADVADPKGRVTMSDALLLLRRLRGY